MTVPRGPDKLDTNARVEVRANGVVVGTRRIIDLIGSGVTITGVDDKGVDDKVTLTLTVPSGSAPPSGTAGGSLDGTYPNPGIAASVAGAGLAETSDVLSVNVGTGLSIVSDAVKITDTGISPGTYGGPGTDLTLTLNAQGQVTSAVNSPSTGPGGGSAALFGLTCFFNATQLAVVSGSVQTYTMTWASATDATNSAITVPPDGFGLDFTLDGIVTDFTATDNGVWLVSAFASAPATATGNYVSVTGVESSTVYTLSDFSLYHTSLAGAGFSFEADGHAIFVLALGETITLSSEYLTTAGVGLTSGGAQITRLA